MYDGEVPFIDLTGVATNELKSHIAGYLLFVDYMSQGIGYFMVVMLQSNRLKTARLRSIITMAWVVRGHRPYIHGCVHETGKLNEVSCGSY